MTMDILSWLADNWRLITEAVILTLAIFTVLKLIQSARGLSIVRGMLIIGFLIFFMMYLTSKWLDLPNINWLLDRFIPLLLVTLIIVFQPEIRHGFVRIGQNNQFLKLGKRKQSKFIKVLVNSAFKLSSRGIGAIIALQREDSLNRYAEGGVKLNSEISPDLVVSIFWPGSPLHDGATIVADEKIKAAGSLFPLSENPNIPSHLGTRHRAGIGVTEETDAVAIIVSEETGKVSIAVRGHLTYDVKMETLESILNELYLHEEDKSAGLDVSKES